MKKKSKLLITISAAIFSIAIAAAVILIVNYNKKSTTTVAFYNIPEDYTKIFQNIITTDNSSKIKFVNITEKDLNALPKKADFLITYNGALTQSLKDSAVPVPEDIMSRFPRTISSSLLYNTTNNNTIETPVIFPIALDLFETMVLTTAVNYYDLPLPDTTTALADFGKKAGEIYPIPIVISGGNDHILNCFFSQLVEAFGGEAGYMAVRNQLMEDKELENFYNYTVTSGVTVSTILDLINEWENLDVLSSTWRKTTDENTAQLIEDNRVAMALMTLSHHRNVNSANLNYYETIVFPNMPQYSDGQRAVIEPAIVAMAFRNKDQIKIIENRLTTSANQELISIQTGLGPATLKGTAFDRQADDCRFFAASFPAGPVPDLASLAFVDKEMIHKMAEKIRNY